MHVKKVLQKGSMFDAAVLDLDDSTILAKFRNGINNMTALSLGLGYPTQCSAPHTILKGFKNLIAISAMTGYEFEQGQAFLKAAANAPAAGPATTAAAPKEEAPKEDAK